MTESGEACATPARSNRKALSLWMAFGITGLVACDMAPPEPDPSMSEQAVATREAPAERLFEGELYGTRMALLVHDCEVYRVERLANGGVQWHPVLAPEPYPFWTACQRQSIALEDGKLTVTLGRMAFGAGGCCATGGTYRLADGRTWKKIS